MEYRIVIAGQGRQNVERVTAPYQSETVAVCLNSKHGGGAMIVEALGL